MIKFLNQGGYFEVDRKKLEIQELEQEMNRADFWNDSNRSTMVIDKLNSLKRDRKSVVQGKSVDLGGRRIIKKKNRF